MTFNPKSLEELLSSTPKPSIESTKICEHNYSLTKPYIKNFRIAIDVGCKIGEYTKCLINDFDKIYSFDMRNKMRIKNPNVTFLQNALGDCETNVSYNNAVIDNKVNSKHKTTRQKTLDSYEFDHVDHIKIDVEGHELKVLQGAIKTLEKCKPTILIEQNKMVEKHSKGKMYDALDFLLDNDYQLVDYNGMIDFVVVHKDNTK